MRFAFLFLFIACGVHAQDRIYRCGNEYTHNLTEAQAASRGCKALNSNNITVVQGTKVQNASSSTSSSTNTPRPATVRIDSGEQRVRDGEARLILETELKKAESRQAELMREYNNGEPEKQGAEARNYQKYLDRVAELKASITRNENDIAGLRRELGRLNPPSAPASAAK